MTIQDIILIMTFHLLNTILVIIIKMPVLIIRGDADPYLSAEIAERLHEDIPGSKLVRVAEASHFIQIDDPKRVTSELISFMGKD